MCYPAAGQRRQLSSCCRTALILQLELPMTADVVDAGSHHAGKFLTNTAPVDEPST
jgi:hypothetical protein